MQGVTLFYGGAMMLLSKFRPRPDADAEHRRILAIAIASTRIRCRPPLLKHGFRYHASFPHMVIVK